jgi:hypothetical protein
MFAQILVDLLQFQSNLGFFAFIFSTTQPNYEVKVLYTKQKNSFNGIVMLINLDLSKALTI